MIWVIDSHIHMHDNEYDEILDHIVNLMKKNNMKACCVSTDYNSSIKTMSLCTKSDLFLPFIGMHPNQIYDNMEIFIKFAESNISQIKGFGEIGLDKTYPQIDNEYKKQISCFMLQLELAEKFNKPVSIHSRNTIDDVCSILSSYSIPKISLHWFDGNKKQLSKAMELGFFVSYGPLLVYAKDKQYLLSKTNVNQILVETDGPVKFSNCFRRRYTQPSLIYSVILSASKILDMEYTELTKILEINSTNFLCI